MHLMRFTYKLYLNWRTVGSLVDTVDRQVLDRKADGPLGVRCHCVFISLIN